MNRMKRDVPIYALSAALVFLGISISANQASAAYDPNAANVSALQSQVRNLQSQLSSFKTCANSNFNTISFFDSTRNPRMMFVRACY